MRVWIARHGEAESGGSDDRRRLTERGRREIERFGRELAASGVAPETIRHSGKARAAETAAILAAALGAHLDPEPLAELAPGADPFAAAAWIERQTAPSMLVGHLPLVERLVAVLEEGRVEAPGRPFPPGAVACLERRDGSWELRWLRGPKGGS